MSDHLDALKRVPLFAGLSTSDLESLARSLRERTYDEGATIVREGEPGVGFFLIAEGEVEVSKGGKAIRRMGPGEFFGELALLVPEAGRVARVRAATDVRCLTIPRGEFLEVLDDEPRLARTLLEHVARRLVEARSPS